MAVRVNVKEMQVFLAWLEACPFEYHVSSMQGGAFHVKFVLATSEETEKPKGRFKLTLEGDKDD